MSLVLWLVADARNAAQCKALAHSLRGGSRAGTTYGATDEFGYHAIEGVCDAYDLWATVLHLLGLDHERLTYRYGGRDVRLTDVHGDVIRGVLG